MDAGFCGWAADDADGLARAFAGASIGLGALSADRQAAPMPHAAIAFYTLEPLKVHADFPPQIALDDIFAVLNRMNDERELLLGQILGANGRIDFCVRQDFFRVGRPNAINVAQGDVDALVGGNFYADDTSHMSMLF